MTTFWLLAIAMSLFALVFMVPPLLSKRNTAAIDRDRLNTALIKEQLVELQADLDAGKLDPAAYAAARHDLERELLNDVGNDAATAAQNTQSGRWAIALFVPLIPLLALFIYQQLGAVGILEQLQSGQPPPSAAAGEPAAHEMQAMVAKLAQRMREQPDNLEGWVLLGRSYASMKRFQDAANAYAQARRLGGDQPELLIDYADMLIVANQGEFSDEVGQLLNTALQQQSENIKGRWLMGHWYFSHGNLQAAIDNWQQAAGQLPPNGPDAAAINQQIQQAKAMLSGNAGAASTDAQPPGPAPAAQEAAATPATAIELSVSLDESMKDKVSGQETVFIFARAFKGPRMPLAIVRKQVSDLPVTVTLDDSMAMTPAMVMSNFPELTIGARISKSGQAIPEPGDLQGILEPVSRDQQDTLNLIINQILP